MNTRKSLFFFIVIFLLSSNLSWADADSYYPMRLKGAWQITLSITPDPNIPFVPETITLLANFTRSGEFISSTDLPTLNVPLPDGSMLPLKVGTGHGVWIKNGYNDFTLKTKRIVQLAVPPELLFGFATGTADVSFEDRNTLVGQVVLQLFSADGTALPPAFGELTGVRLFIDG